MISDQLPGAAILEDVGWLGTGVATADPGVDMADTGLGLKD